MIDDTSELCSVAKLIVTLCPSMLICNFFAESWVTLLSDNIDLISHIHIPYVYILFRLPQFYWTTAAYFKYQSFWSVLFLCAPEPGHIFTGHAFGLIGISPLRGSHRGASHCSDGSRLCFRCSLHNGDTSIPLCLVIAFAAVALRRQRTVKAKGSRSFTGAHGAYRLQPTAERT